MAAFETPLTAHAGIEVPLICGAMYPCSNPELVAAASEAGGIGILQPLSLTYVHGYDFREGLCYIRRLTSRPIGMNALIEKGSKRYHERMSEWVDIALEDGVRFFVTSLGKPRWVVDRVVPHGGVVYHDVTERKWALKGLESGVHGLIGVNRRAGGHAGPRAVEALIDPGRGGLGARHVTVSTVGLPAGIAELTRWPWQIGLAISLPAASDDIRATLVPLAKHVDLATLMASSIAYQRETRRRVSYEYTMLRDVNDQVAQARDLARLVDGQTCHVNLIPFNPFPGAAYEAPAAGTTRRFRDELQRRGVAATIRRTRGREIAGACGQLRADGAVWRRRSQSTAATGHAS